MYVKSVTILVHNWLSRCTSAVDFNLKMYVRLVSSQRQYLVIDVCSPLSSTYNIELSVCYKFSEFCIAVNCSSVLKRSWMSTYFHDAIMQLAALNSMSVQYLSQLLTQVKHSIKSVMPNFSLNCLMYHNVPYCSIDLACTKILQCRVSVWKKVQCLLNNSFTTRSITYVYPPSRQHKVDRTETDIRLTICIHKFN